MINLIVTPAPARKLPLPPAVDRGWSKPGDPLYLHPEHRDDDDPNWPPLMVAAIADPCGSGCWHHTGPVDDTGTRVMRWTPDHPVLRFGRSA